MQRSVSDQLYLNPALSSLRSTVYLNHDEIYSLTEPCRGLSLFSSISIRPCLPIDLQSNLTMQRSVSDQLYLNPALSPHRSTV
ncbi:hypothetical protein RRG08_023676 [Elysia crispata]|uniref:Uncharacterized protein n=1 Tax=Elysia crispata TaxID=231223 RepID=A0AAE1ALN0_9GAST|nr:hypothetical protein RRG08_023676 [Elysia crispata]